MKLSVIIPTISGREESLGRAIAAYEETLVGVDREIIVIKDAPTWPTACNRGYEQSSGDIVHFSADDLEALPNWWIEPYAILVSGEDILPAPAVFDYLPPPAGKWANEEDGPDGAYCHFTRIPILRRDQYERIGPWPEIVYYADIWVSEKARTLGIRTRVVSSYAFIHHWSGIGRVDSQVNLDEAGFALNRLREQMV